MIESRAYLHTQKSTNITLSHILPDESTQGPTSTTALLVSRKTLRGAQSSVCSHSPIATHMQLDVAFGLYVASSAVKLRRQAFGLVDVECLRSTRLLASWMKCAHIPGPTAFRHIPLSNPVRRSSKVARRTSPSVASAEGRCPVSSTFAAR